MNEKEIQALYSKWRKSGYGFSAPLCKEPVDLEKLILESISLCRENPRLFICLVSWISVYADLINVPRLINFIDFTDSAAAGFVFDCALKSGADNRIYTVINKCIKKKRKETFFEIMKKWKVTENIEKESSLETASRWGFYCSKVEVRKELVFDRKYVLKNNKNFAVRAFFGTNSRAEILNYLLHNPQDYIRRISNRIGISYQPVYKEIMKLVENRFLNIEVMGKNNMVSLSSKAEKFLRLIPV